jgi:Family of unknown function (DUF6152)
MRAFYTMSRLPPRLCFAALNLAGVVALSGLSVATATAHHSFAMFDAAQTLNTVGTVKEFQWGSPHTWVELIVVGPDKIEKPLSLELTTISGLKRNGWKPTTLKPGDKVTVTYHPMRDGTPAGQLVDVVTEDGQTLKGQ